MTVLPGGMRAVIDAPVHAPHEETRIEVVVGHVAAPALAPDGDVHDDRLELAPRVRQGVSTRLALHGRLADHESGALECAMSRVYLGIHFRYDSIEGNKLGKRVGRFGWENHLVPVSRRSESPM